MIVPAVQTVVGVTLAFLIALVGFEALNAILPPPQPILTPAAPPAVVVTTAADDLTVQTRALVGYDHTQLATVAAMLSAVATRQAEEQGHDLATWAATRRNEEGLP